MKQTIPFKKIITFNNKFESISSLNLEHDYYIDSSLVKGTFYVYGTYRSTEASLVDEDFNYNIPFEIALSNRVKEESVNLNIEDFNYEVSDSDKVTLLINLVLECEEDNVFSFMDELSNEEDRVEEDMEEILLNFNEEVDNTSLEENVVSFDEIKNENINITNNYNNIYSFVSDKKDFITYKIYFVKEGDSYETISSMFDISIDELSKYNEIKELKKGDKVIVPYVFQ